MAANIGYLALSVGLSILSNQLLRKKKSPFQDERPPTLATRGSYAPWISGRRRVGSVVTWIGQRGSRKEKPAGGKGDVVDDPLGQKRTTWYESAMHVLAVGPVNALRRIEAGGEVLFEGLITPDSHPSGSTLPGTFGQRWRGFAVIYWGEDDQPIPNTTVNGAAGAYNLSAELGVASRWPNFCYIHWIDFRLGENPVWPAITYDIEKVPTGNYLSNTQPSVSDETFTITDFESTVDDVSGAASGLIELDLSSNPNYNAAVLRQALLAAQGGRVRLEGNSGLSDRDLTLVSVSARPTVLDPHEIEVAEDITGITADGTITPYSSDQAYGTNAAHAIADMLFEAQPYGIGLDQADWDIDSLEDLGTLMETEGLQTSWLGKEGASAEEVLGPGLQDLGVMVPTDPETGKLKFVPVREPSGTLRSLPNEAIVDRLPELEKSLGPAPSDFLIFSFPDQDSNYRDMTLGRMEDGQIGQLEAFRAKTVNIAVSTHFDTSASIADRRSQEDFTQGAIWSLRTGRETRLFFPGEAITADFSAEVLRVVSVKPRVDSGSVDLRVMSDSYGLPAADFTDVQPPVVAPGGVVGDAQWDAVEPTEFINAVPPQSISLLRIRATQVTTGSVLHASSDDTTFESLGSLDGYQIGGTLAAELPATGDFEPADSTLVLNVLGDDISEAQDLSADDTNWRLGRQICVIVSSAGTEICFLQRLTTITATTSYLQGLIRARAGTRRLTHPAGARVYILPSADISPFSDALLAPEVTRYFKSQPYGQGSTDLSLVDSKSLLLYGHGVRPLPVSSLRVTAPDLISAYGTGEDVTVEWDYSTPRTPGTAAGLQDAGSAVGTTAPEGDFQVEILNTSDTVVATYSVSTNSFDYTNASIIADLGSQVSFKVRVTQLRDGYSSSTETITVEKI